MYGYVSKALVQVLSLLMPHRTQKPKKVLTKIYCPHSKVYDTQEKVIFLNIRKVENG
jgi:hypothetical protein